MSLTGRVGLGPVAYQVDPIRKCDEKVIDSCKTSHKCCAVISCEYCLEWIPYGEEPILGSASSTDDGGITGEVNGMQFRAEWQREVYANACQLWVYVDDVLQAIIPLCGDTGVTCRNLSYSLGQLVTQNDEEGYVTEPGELVWTRKEKRPLPYRKDDTLCTQHFCGNCECTCKCLCVKLVEPDGSIYIAKFCDTAYSECEGPVWSGELNYRFFSLALGRDQNDDSCVVSVSEGGDEYEPVPAAECDRIEGSIVLGDYAELSWECETCEGCDTPPPTVSTPTCPCDPMPRTLRYSFSAYSGPDLCNGSGTLEYQDGNLVPTWSGMFLDCEFTVSCVQASVPGANPCVNSNGEFIYQVSVCGTIAYPLNQQYDDLNGECFCPLYIRVCFLNTICGGVGDGLICFEFSE